MKSLYLFSSMDSNTVVVSDSKPERWQSFWHVRHGSWFVVPRELFQPIQMPVHGSDDIFEIFLNESQELISANKNGELMPNENELPFVIVRTYSAGVFAGELESRKDKEVVLKNARRIWQWSGAASLSEMAMKGVKRPNECKVPCAVDQVTLMEAIEILSVTDKARKSIMEIPEWQG